MIDRICISINNHCNLKCDYCHFREKAISESNDMDVSIILNNVISYAQHTFKVGLVGNGEPLLDFNLMKTYIEQLSASKWVHVYTITNGTIPLKDEDWVFMEKYNVNVGFSIDGYKELHDKYRDHSFNKAMENVECYKRVTGHYPTFNATVGKETVENFDKVIEFFSKFGTRVTFSRMIGKYGISLNNYKDFIDRAEKYIKVRRGGLDCTMYGGKCGAGQNNFFFANGKVYYCGNCIDMPGIGKSTISFHDLEKKTFDFDQNLCYKESLL